MVGNVQHFTASDVLVILSASRYATVCFGNDLGFRPLIQDTGRFCVSNTFFAYHHGKRKWATIGAWDSTFFFIELIEFS